MIEKIMKELMNAGSTDEILAYKSSVVGLYNSMYNKICNQGLSVTNYYDIKSLHSLEDPMMAYYGPYFYRKCGIPFLKKHNPSTIEVIEFSVLFYSLQIMELMEDGFFDEASLCIYDEELYNDVFDHIEKINLCSYKYKQYLFSVLWFYFMRVISIEDNEREFTLEYDFNTDIFYLDDEKHEEVIDLIYKNYNNSKYSSIIDKILGIYRIRFTKMKYILEYQPLFVKVGYEYICAIMVW